MGATGRCSCGLPLPAAGGCRRCGPDRPPWYDQPTVPHAARPPVPPPTVPGYEIEGEIGRGGMGVVYKARQEGLNRTVALKMILAGPHAGPKERDRFRREAESVAALQHPHIVQIFDIGEHAGQPYLALEYVPGGTLADRLLGHPWSPAAAAELIEVLARAVQYAHDRGIVHRDLKPANILLGNDECGITNDDAQKKRSEFIVHHSSFILPKLTDFGLAKRVRETPPEGERTGTGAVLGTPSYIAPEQAGGAPPAGGEDVVGPAADVYSLGAILYELLTGRPPFHGGTTMETVVQVLTTDPVPPSRLRPKLPRDLETLCLACLHKHPGRRYASAAALADDLARFRRGEAVRARPLSPAVRVGRMARRHPALAALAGTSVAAVVALVAVLAVAYARVREAVREKDEEARNATARRVEADVARTTAMREQRRAEQSEREARALAEQLDRARQAAESQARALAEQADQVARGAFTLQLARAHEAGERQPGRAAALLADPERCPPRLREFTWNYLRRLADREERAYLHHPNGLSAVAAAGGAAVAVTADAGPAGRVRAWDPRTGATWAVLIGPTDGAMAVGVSRDGSRVVAGGADGRLWVWDLPADVVSAAATTLDPAADPATPGTPVGTAVVAHPGGVRAVGLSADGRTVVSGGADGQVRVWRVAGGPPLPAAVAAAGPAAAGSGGRSRLVPAGVFRGHPGGAVLAVAVAPDGRSAATGGADRVVRVWPLGGGPAGELAPHAGPVRALAYSPDGRLLATADDAAEPCVRLWDARTLASRGRLSGHAGSLAAISFSPDGSLVAGGGADAAVRLWDPDDGRDHGVIDGHARPVTGVAFAAGGRTLVTASADATARVWLARPAGADTAVLAGGTIAMPGYPVRTAAGGKIEPAVTAAAVAADWSVLVTGDAAGHFHAWRLDEAAGRPVRPGSPTDGRLPVGAITGTRLGSGPATDVAVSRTGRYAVLATPIGVVRYDLGRRVRWPGGAMGPDCVCLWQKVYGDKDGPPATAVAISPDDRLVAVADAAGGVYLHDMRTGDRIAPAPVAPVRGTKLVRFVTVPLHPGLGQLLAVADGPVLRIVDAAGRAVGEVPHRADVTAVAFDPFSGRMATGDADGRVRVWTVGGSAALEVTEQVVAGGHAEAVTALAFSHDGKTLASGGRDRAVTLWDPVTGQERATLTGHPDPIVGLGFGERDESLVSVGRDGHLSRWRADPKRRAGPPFEFPQIGSGPPPRLGAALLAP